MKEHLMFAFKVAVAILIINQSSTLSGLVNKNYLNLGI
jgi:hypothetical protein